MVVHVIREFRLVAVFKVAVSRGGSDLDFQTKKKKLVF